MECGSYLLFRLSDAVYAVPAQVVMEILPLPGLSRLDEVPNFVVGILNLRGQVVPIIDLNIRFGRPRQTYSIEQCVVVLKQDGPAIGMIVDAPESVVDIASDEIVPASSYGSDPAEAGFEFIQGVVKTEDRIVMVLQLDHLLSLSQHVAEQYSAPEIALLEAFVPSHSVEELAMFEERSRRFSKPVETEERTGGFAVALVRIGAELFGVELSTIREFADLRHVAPVPCCPEHVVGQMNLRGEIITVVDVARALGLPPPIDRSPRKLVVLDSPQFACGVQVDDLLDVFYLVSTDISPILSVADGVGREHLRGSATHETRTFSYIDLSALLASGSLAVNENP